MYMYMIFLFQVTESQAAPERDQPELWYPGLLSTLVGSSGGDQVSHGSEESV